jgi:lipopolysaccharide assembly outer membrane protein LptD (OstA)
MQLARSPRLTGVAMALWLAWGCWSGTPAAAQDDEQATASVEPDLPKDINIEFFRLTLTEDGDYDFIGPVTITWRESRIQADRLKLSQQRFIEAEGNVLIAWADGHIFGTRMEYDLETNRRRRSARSG